LVADGVDPSVKREAEQDSTAYTFSSIAQEWLLTKKETLSEGTWQRDHDQLAKMLEKPNAEADPPRFRGRLPSLGVMSDT